MVSTVCLYVKHVCILLLDLNLKIYVFLNTPFSILELNADLLPMACKGSMTCPAPHPRDPQAAHSAESHGPSPCPSHCPSSRLQGTHHSLERPPAHIGPWLWRAPSFPSAAFGMCGFVYCLLPRN